jgi:hypothetical protein
MEGPLSMMRSAVLSIADVSSRTPALKAVSKKIARPSRPERRGWDKIRWQAIAKIARFMDGPRMQQGE